MKMREQQLNEAEEKISRWAKSYAYATFMGAGHLRFTVIIFCSKN